MPSSKAGGVRIGTDRQNLRDNLASDEIEKKPPRPHHSRPGLDMCPHRRSSKESLAF
jgi:hypothetical protein